jgi:hypothetical protein
MFDATTTPTLTLDDLAHAKRWCAWQEEVTGKDKAGNDRITKVPYGQFGKADSTNPKTWLTRAEAEQVAARLKPGGTRLKGIGIFLGPGPGIPKGYGLGGVDLDTCFDPNTWTPTPWAGEVLKRLGSYAEISPSGCGVKVYFLYKLADLPAIRTVLGLKADAWGGELWKEATGQDHPPGIEVYLGKRYFTVTEDNPGWSDTLRVLGVEDFQALGDIAQALPSGGGTGGAGTGAGKRDDSRSAHAYRLALDMQADGKTYEEWVAAVQVLPEAGDWFAEKGSRHGEREAHKTWDRAGEEIAKRRSGEEFRPEDGPEPAPTPSEWPEPLDLFGADVTIPVLTPAHLPGALAGFVFDLAERMGIDPAMPALFSTIACASVMSDASWFLQPTVDASWQEQARLWGGAITDPGEKKTPTLNRCVRPIEQLEQASRRQHAAAMQQHKADHALWKSVKNNPNPEPQPPKLARYLVDDFTIEALSDVLRDRADPDATMYAAADKVLVRKDELAEIFASLDRYSSGSGGKDRGPYLRLYNGGFFPIDRIKRGAMACPNWSGCVVGGIQPDPIRRIAVRSVDDGLLQRMLYFVGTGPRTPVERLEDSLACSRYDRLFPTLARLQAPMSVVLHPDAKRLFDDTRAMLAQVLKQPDLSKRLVTSLAKWDGTLARLALTFHGIELADELNQGGPARKEILLLPDTMQQATGYMRDVLLPHLIRADDLLFDSMQSSHARWIARFLVRRKLSRVEKRDIIMHYRALQAPELRDTLDGVLENLCITGWLRPLGGPVGRRPTIFAVNPKIHSGQFNTTAGVV